MKKILLHRDHRDGLNQILARDLNQPQREAALAPDGFNLILAGPGSGKTRVITYRVAYLIARGVPAESILLVTFTRRAAREMIERLEALVGASASKVWAGTFHHVGNRLLREAAEAVGYAQNFTILDSEDQHDLIGLAMTDVGLAGQEKLVPKPVAVAHLLSFAFNTATPLEELVAQSYARWMEWLPLLQQTELAYKARKRAANCMDYDDLLGLWAQLLRSSPEHLAAQSQRFQHLLVDELQDTNQVQIELVETLAKSGHGNLTGVGDDAQSIYRFRGAHYDNILKFPERNPSARVFNLNVNYRSTPEIVAFTNASIANNQTGFPKHLVSRRESGSLPIVAAAADGHEEADLIAQLVLEAREQGIGLERQAVLYRNHHDSILLQAELVARNIPYNVRSGLRFFEQAHIKDVLAYLRIQANSRDEAAWRRLLLLLPGIGPAKAGALFEQLARSSDPLAAIASRQVMDVVPARGRGQFAAFVADLRKVRNANPATNPAEAIQAVLQGGYPAVVQTRYPRPENRIADIEQLAVLATRFESTERLVSDLMLAGDVYGVDTLRGADTDELLTLSSIHQAKGLEWQRVYVPRLVEGGFPNQRSLDEPGGEEEERRIFYVAVTRARDELFLTYPVTVTQRGRGSTQVTKISRFLAELEASRYERAEVEVEVSRFDPIDVERVLSLPSTES
jgi:DNA helicase-2/ATP-dependent DNA helicase PcrA